MVLNEKILSQLKICGNVITTEQVQRLGFSKSLLTLYIRQELLERIAHGVYVVPGELYDEMYVLSLISEKFVFSHETALFLHGLSERTPARYSVAVISGLGISKSIKRFCDCYYVKHDLFELGSVNIKTPFGNYVRCYDKERTVCDILRSYSRTDEETIFSLLKSYVKREDKDLNLLSVYAEKLGVLKSVRQYMGVLL